MCPYNMGLSGCHIVQTLAHSVGVIRLSKMSPYHVRNNRVVDVDVVVSIIMAVCTHEKRRG